MYPRRDESRDESRVATWERLELRTSRWRMRFCVATVYSVCLLMCLLPRACTWHLACNFSPGTGQRDATRAARFTPLAMDQACSYSTSVERRCATDEEGRLRCQMLRRTFRHCPGKPAEEVERIEEESDGAAAEWSLTPSPFGSGSPFGNGFPFGGNSSGADAQARDPFTDPFMDSLLGSFFGNTFGGLLGGGLPRGPEQSPSGPPERRAAGGGRTPQEPRAAALRPRVDEV